MATTYTDPLLGRLVDGRYEVAARIARGGMATVYLAVDRRLDRQVALKVMHPHLAEGHDVAARFRREARAAARLTHPGVVGVYDQGSEGETSYLTMEYVQGTNLREALRSRGAFSLGEALAIIAQVLDALGAAHRACLVHRDIKPENVLVADDGRIKVADFGLARAVTEATAATTGTLLGTVAYLSPEIVTSGVADARADVYAVGVLLYELLTGHQPFEGETPIQIAYKHVHEAIPPPSAERDWLPSSVDELVTTLTAREPADRPRDAAIAAELLRTVRSGLTTEQLSQRAEVQPAPGTDRVEEPAPGDDEETRSVQHAAHGGTISLPIGAVTAAQPRREIDALRRRHRRRRITAVLAVLLLLLAAAGAGWWYLFLGPGSYTTVPDVVGEEEAQALAAIEAAELRVQSSAEHHDSVPQGQVISSDPQPGAELARDSLVSVVVSRGVLMVTMPEVVDLPEDEALAQIEAAEFSGTPDVTSEYSDDVEEGQVISVSPEAGAEVEHDTPVTLTVSAGRQPVTVPNVTGAAEQEAVSELEGAGLQVQVGAREHSDEVPEGQVISQDVEGDALRGDTITLEVSLGPELVEVPSVVGETYSGAEEILVEAGFVVERDEVLGGFFNTVRDQDPEPGAMAPRGATITLTVV